MVSVAREFRLELLTLQARGIRPFWREGQLKEGCSNWIRLWKCPPTQATPEMTNPALYDGHGRNVDLMRREIRSKPGSEAGIVRLREPVSLRNSIERAPTVIGVARSIRSYAATPNSSATRVACAIASSFTTHLTLPFRRFHCEIGGHAW
jgi:hypothetical protein